MRVHIPYALRIQVLRRRGLEVLNSLDEFDPGAWLRSLEILVGALRLVRFAECLGRGTRDGSVVRAGPGGGVIDGGVGWEVTGDEEDGLGGVLLLDA